jgi:hypothetical protein
MELDRNTAQQLFDYYRKHRDGIRNKAEMASVCMICGSIHVIPKEGEPGMLTCRNCGFAFYRCACKACGKTVDGRDPQNPGCRVCGLRVCTCGACGCSTGSSNTTTKGAH